MIDNAFHLVGTIAAEHQMVVAKQVRKRVLVDNHRLWCKRFLQSVVVNCRVNLHSSCVDHRHEKSGFVVEEMGKHCGHGQEFERVHANEWNIQSKRQSLCFRETNSQTCVRTRTDAHRYCVEFDISGGGIAHDVLNICAQQGGVFLSLVIFSVFEHLPIRGECH